MTDRQSSSRAPGSAAASPSPTFALLSAALTHHRASRCTEAEHMYRMVLRAEPGNADACHWLGMLLSQSGPDVARGQGLKLLEQSVSIAPNVPEFHNNLAAVLGELGQTDAAIAHAREAVRLRPAFASAWHNLGVALEHAGLPAEAVAAYDRALALDPQSAAAHTHRGNALRRGGRAEESLAAHRRALELQPAYAEAAQNLAVALGEQGRLDEMIACYRRAIEFSPGNAALHSDLLYALLHDPTSTPQSLLREASRWASRHDRPNLPPPRHLNQPDPGRRLRVGYVSPDFRRHTIPHLIAPVLASHDRGRLEVFCYSAVAAPDAVTRRLQGLSDHWREIARLPDAAAEALIRQDGIDILVDLAGHMAGNRLTLFARRPAPVQVQLGYAGTTGLPAIGYRITDAHCDPPGLTEQYHTERLLRLPSCAWPYEPDEADLPVAPPPSLAADHVTFGCLNKPIKISDDTVALWARVLEAVPGSRLLGLAGGAHPANSSLCDRLVRRGIPKDRLELVGPRPRRQYLELYHRIDVALDPLPYSGDTTTCDALWMGVPVVTLAGDRFASRRGVSHLTNVGLAELVASSAEGYVARAAALASDPPRLASLRRSLRRRIRDSALADGRGYTARLERAYREVWKEWCGRDR